MIKDTSATDEHISSTKLSKKNYINIVAVIALIAFVGILSVNALSFSGTAARSIDRELLQLATVERGDIVRDVLASGRIVAANAPQLYSPEQGFVTLMVKAGDKVDAGQLVASVDSPELDNQLKQHQSELVRLQGELSRQELASRKQALELTKSLDLAKVDLEAADREERRAQASIVNNLISQIDLEKAIDDLARAKLTYKHAQQEVDLTKDTLQFELENAKQKVERQDLVVQDLQRQINDLNITASVTGVVGNLLTTNQALVNKNQALMTLVDLSAYEAQLNVSESYANELALGMPVQITAQGRVIEGVLSGISPEVSNREVITRVRFDSEQVSGIRQNQQVSGRILLENKEDVLKVRRGSFVQSGGFVAYRVEGDIATKIDIQIGAVSVREVEILAGLNPNDQIIISNYEAFIDSESLLLN
ncbi:efflux RND transporter periplasmic adaptor subunit [Ningiella sp. W23]|uniref:efflux RND transporter periplasmic adaptor subunit n=1 Tax=Ningiella sp. W23 TaxID=3023715 RepID=UPI00375630EF